MRRGPRLWTSVSGEDCLISKIEILCCRGSDNLVLPHFSVVYLIGQQMSEFSNSSPYISFNNAEGKTVRQPSVIYSWIQNKREQVG